MLRVFLAIEIPDELKKKIVEIQNSFQNTGVDIKLVERENLHFCLKFLGNRTEDEVKRIGGIVENVCKVLKRFELEIAGIGVFPSIKYPRVIWLGAKGEELVKLFKEIDDGLSSIGVEKEKRAFKAHLTLGRLRSQKNKDILIKKVKDNTEIRIGKFVVGEVVLFQSKLSPKGPTYTKLKEFRLK